MKNTSIQERSWIFYDWANSAYSIAITTAIFPLFYKAAAAQAGIAGNVSTAYLGYANSFATLLISLFAPILGTIADYRDKKKRFFLFFFLLGVAFTGLLAVVPNGQWQILLGFYVLTAVGFSGANIFYDAFLVDVTTSEKMDSISTRGYAYGYIGSTIPFIISVAIIFFHGKMGIAESTAYQIGFVITALWWGLFTISMLRNVKQIYCIEPEPRTIVMSFKRLINTLKTIRKHKHIF